MQRIRPLKITTSGGSLFAFAKFHSLILTQSQVESQ